MFYIFSSLFIHKQNLRPKQPRRPVGGVQVTMTSWPAGPCTTTGQSVSEIPAEAAVFSQITKVTTCSGGKVEKTFRGNVWKSTRNVHIFDTSSGSGELIVLSVH